MYENECQIDAISKELNYFGALNLIMAIFRLTAQDLKYGNKEIRKEAKKFLRSIWFEDLCDGMNLNSDRVKNIIIKSDRVSTRGKYE